MPPRFSGYTARMNLSGKIALVTGGTRGIGAATAISLARDGADVAIVGRNSDADATATRDAILALGRRCEIILADCGKPDEATRSVKETESRLGAVDVLVHSAGGPVNGGLFDLTPEAWTAAFDVHVHAIFYLCRAVIPAMKTKKEGAIILISSTAGIRGIITNIAYQTAKGALPQFTRALAREFASDNIRVNCVAPGVIRTRFHATMSPEQKKLNLEQRIPLKREGTSEQVAELILTLVRNDYITGETMTIDGGLTMRIA
ncbi:MAG TPA: SDR family oxidoreductase [Verrucomicrobiae bacterium]|nr:SDR family oxidoreductase [Verrucomicrobiae bacterium]